MARKSSLREFQRSVAERLRDPSKLRAAASKLGFKVADENWFVSLSDVAEVIAVPVFVPVPQTQSWFKGVANVRGRLYSVADFAAFQGRAASTPTAERRVVLIHERLLEAAGIVVSSMMGLRNPDAFVSEEIDTTDRPWIKGKYRDPAGEAWFELDVAALAKSPAFLEVATATSAPATSDR